MTYKDFIKESVLKGFSYTDISTAEIVITIGIAYIIALYIHLVYRIVTKNAFYFKNFGIAMTLMSVITAGIILAMQSSLVISLGMVGALSIVRFRTAIKDPLDLLFLFWSIGSGIICGAGLYELAIITAGMATIGIVLFEILPVKSNSFLLVINALSSNAMEKIEEVLKIETQGYKIKSKNITKNGMDLIIEVKLKNKDHIIVEQLLNESLIDSVTLLENNVDVKS